MKLTRYQANGFIPVNEPPARRNALAATVTIVKGDVLQDDGSGYMTNAGTAFAATHMGVAAAGVVGDSSTKYVEYYPLDTKTQYSVPVAANAVITRDAIGSIVDLEANDDIDISDTVSEGIGFMIDDIDISADAIAANTYGYAIGHFVVVGTEA
ncbi:MAG: hypothetical protein WC530_11100 [Candidatus Omnitrophota bacterium]